MKKVLLLCAALALFATSAFAAGADLTANACPGGAGVASDAGTLDCANSATLQMYVTFQPGEAATDLTGIDAVLDYQVQGDLATTATFWDFESFNQAALANNHVRPSTICNNYTAAWSPSGSGEGLLAFKTGPSIERIKALAYRPPALSYTLNQKLFGFGMTVDASTSAEAGGGGGPGCALPVCFVLNNVFPRLISGNVTQDLFGSAGAVGGGNTVTVNGGAALCGAVPAKKHTWGQLKSLSLVP